MNKKILAIALPSILSNITVPLLALVDLAIAGHLGERAYIGAIAIGGLFFNILYLVFGFLRMGTGGLTAQAYGKNDKRKIMQTLTQAIVVAVGLSTLILTLQYPLEKVFFQLIDTSVEIEGYAQIYIRTLVWGAPAALLLYVFYGWFIGLQNARFQTYVAVSSNIINIGLSLFFVHVCQMGIKGIALGTLIAQYSGLLLVLILGRRTCAKFRPFMVLKDIFDFSTAKKTFVINRNIFLRTICLICVMSFFTYASAQQGETNLAINTLLLQLFTLFSYFIDGFAYSGEALIGKYVGAKKEKETQKAVRILFVWGLSLATIFSLAYTIGSGSLLSLLTNDKQLIAEAKQYFFWAAAIPLVSFGGFVWDGIYIGATATSYMLKTALGASFVFFGIVLVFSGTTNNHILWCSFLLFLFTRGLLQTFYARAIFQKKNT